MDYIQMLFGDQKELKQVVSNNVKDMIVNKKINLKEMLMYYFLILGVGLISLFLILLTVLGGSMIALGMI